MDDKDRRAALELKQRISGFAKLVDFRVFGSRARGDADPYSDMDVFIEVEGLDRAHKELILDAVWEVGFENFMVIVPLVFTRNELENTALRSSPIVEAIARDGVSP